MHTVEPITNNSLAYFPGIQMASNQQRISYSMQQAFWIQTKPTAAFLKKPLSYILAFLSLYFLSISSM